MMLTGTTIVPGIACGPAMVWKPENEPVPQLQIPPASVGLEKQRLQHATRRAQRELEEIALRVEVSAGKSAADIFRAHAAMLRDAVLAAAIMRHIEEEHWAAESAVARTFESYAERLARAEGAYFAARAEDFADLGRRLLSHLRKEGPRRIPCPSWPSVLVVDNLAAADVMALDRTNVLALVMMQSGATSHAALLASTLGVPVVGGVPQLAGQVHDGDTVIIDGNHGHVLVNPTELAQREYSIRREIFQRFCGELAGLRELPAETLDGHKVQLCVNIGLMEEVPNALAQGAEGIGLLRTEYYFLSHSRPPSEEEQYQFYTSIVQAVAPHPVTFRTFDLGADKMAGNLEVPEPNPMLGCRGIRVLREEPDQFTAQIKALLRASAHGRIRIMFPLITSLTEFQDTMLVVNKIKRRLDGDGVVFDQNVSFGCMIETPAAATIPDILATEVEFFSIGSNDLIQYTLAADRTNPRVAYIYEPLHMAVLRMMRGIIRAGHRRRRTISLCGEMASDPIYTIILLGLGIDQLSVNPAMVPAIKQIIRNVRFSDAHEVARGVLQERRAKDVQSYLEQMMADRFPQVMSIYGRSA
jgi:phosphoenolpyruvate-protein phosphotransferase (PTS system enzyme I)